MTTLVDVFKYDSWTGVHSPPSPPMSLSLSKKKLIAVRKELDTRIEESEKISNQFDKNDNLVEQYDFIFLNFLKDIKLKPLEQRLTSTLNNLDVFIDILKFTITISLSTLLALASLNQFRPDILLILGPTIIFILILCGLIFYRSKCIINYNSKVQKTNNEIEKIARSHLENKLENIKKNLKRTEIDLEKWIKSSDKTMEEAQRLYTQDNKN